MTPTNIGDCIMPTTKSSPFMSEPLIHSVGTNVDRPTSSSSGISPVTANHERWDRLIDDQLIEWGSDTDRFEDEGIDSPTPETIQRAIMAATKFRDAGYVAPDSVVPDASGGIVFERRENDVSEVIHVWDDGAIEYQRFNGTQLIHRRPL